jgi:hypothetical protein
MDATRSGEVLARHAGIDKETGQLAAGEDEGPRRLVISSDFYAVYESAGNRADGIVNLYCWAHARRHFVRAGDANPAQLGFWVKAWLDRVRDLYAAHRQLTAAWREAAPLDAALAAWDEAIGAIDEARREQAKAPGLQGSRSRPGRPSRPSTGNGRVCPRTGTTR